LALVRVAVHAPLMLREAEAALALPLPQPDMINPSAKRTMVAICLPTLPSRGENPVSNEPRNPFLVAWLRKTRGRLRLCIPTLVHYNREFRLDFHGTD